MQDMLDKMMPTEMASAVNLFAHPLAGAAAASALGFGLASHALGAWMGALSGAAEASQRLFRPAGAETAPAGEAEATALAIARARARAKALMDKTVTNRTLTHGTPTDGASTQRVQAEPAATVAVLPAARPRAPQAAARPETPDDLKAISGIGPKLEKVLNGLGIWTYPQIAAWSGQEVAWVDEHLGFNGRIGRDDWTGQAAELAAARQGGN